jgi:hypothetical protein
MGDDLIPHQVAMVRFFGHAHATIDHACNYSCDCWCSKNIMFDDTIFITFYITKGTKYGRGTPFQT